MKKTLPSAVFVVLALTFGSIVTAVHAQGTAFTYQGRLNASGAVANGSFDIAFTLYTTNVTGSANAGPVTNSAVAVPTACSPRRWILAMPTPARATGWRLP